MRAGQGLFVPSFCCIGFTKGALYLHIVVQGLLSLEVVVAEYFDVLVESYLDVVVEGGLAVLPELREFSVSRFDASVPCASMPEFETNKRTT